MRKYRRLILLGFNICLVLAIFNTTFASNNNNLSSKYTGTQLSVLGFNVTTFSKLPDLIKEFEEKTGIKVRLDLFSEKNARQKMGIEMSSGAPGYDVMYFIPTDFHPWVEAGWVEPLDSFINNKKLTSKNEIELNDFLKAPLNLLKKNGKLYGLPMFGATVGFYYRKDIFEQKGIKNPPKTIDELFEVAQKIHSTQVAGIGLRGMAGPNMWTYTMFLKALGGDYYKDYPNDFHPVLDSPQAIKATKLYAELLRNYGMPGSASVNFDEIAVAFQQGRIAMTIDGIPLAPRILDPKQSRVIGKVGFAPLPSGPAGVYPPYTTHGWLIPKASKNKEAAWLFMKWASSTEIQARIALEGEHMAVTRKSVLKMPEYISKYDYWPGFTKMYQSNLETSADYYPLNRAFPMVMARVGRAVNEVTAGAKTAEEAMKLANKDVNDIMKQAGFYKN